MFTVKRHEDGTLTIEGTDPVRRIAELLDSGPDTERLARAMADALNLGLLGKPVCAGSRKELEDDLDDIRAYAQHARELLDDNHAISWALQAIRHKLEHAQRLLPEKSDK